MQFLNNVIVLPPLKIPIRHILSCTSYFFKDGESEAKECYFIKTYNCITNSHCKIYGLEHSDWYAANVQNLVSRYYQNLAF